MVTTVHLLAGAAIAVVLKQPALFIPVAFFTHYLLDAVPHYAPKPIKNFKAKGLKGMSWLDLLVKSLEPVIGVTLVIFYALAFQKERFPVIALGCFFAWVPDGLVFLEWKYKINRPRPLRWFELKTHKHVVGMRGILPQVFVSLCLIIVLYLRLPSLVN